jgi:hypothetical protein
VCSPFYSQDTFLTNEEQTPVLLYTIGGPFSRRGGSYHPSVFSGTNRPYERGSRIFLDNFTLQLFNLGCV